MPRLGLGLGIDKVRNRTPLQLLLKYTSAMWLPSKANGQPFPILEPRTLPNGVSNVGWTQNVSVNVVLQASQVSSLDTTQVNHDVVFINISATPNIVNITGNGTPGIVSESTGLFSNLATYSGAQQYGHFISSNDLKFVVPKGTFSTLQSAKNYFNGVIIRYQLATPIDTLNSPFTNPLIDLKGVVGKNLFDRQSVLFGYEFTSPPTIAPNALWYVSNYMPVTFNTNYFKSGFGTSVGYYDASFNFISATGVGNSTFLIPNNPNIKYVKLNGLISGISTAQLELGSVATAYEPYGKANLLLQGFAGTTSSGYVGVLCPNGKTVPFLKFDAVDDLGIGNHPSLDITGTGDFAIEVVFKTDATLVGGYVTFKGLDSLSASQYALLLQPTGEILLALESTGLSISPNGSLIANSLYSLIIYRVNGTLKSRLNRIQTYNQPNTINVTNRQYFRVGARSNSADGLTHSAFTNIFLGHLSITNGAITPFTEAELISKFDKFTMQTFGI